MLLHQSSEKEKEKSAAFGGKKTPTTRKLIRELTKEKGQQLYEGIVHAGSIWQQHPLTSPSLNHLLVDMELLLQSCSLPSAGLTHSAVHTHRHNLPCYRPLFMCQRTPPLLIRH